MTQAHVLAAYIRSHSLPCRVVDADTLLVASQTSGTAGSFIWSVQRLPVDLSAVRRWLGY